MKYIGLLFNVLFGIFIDCLLVERWKSTDQEICAVLHSVDRDNWDRMLDTIEVYTEELTNLTLQIVPPKVREMWAELDPIVRNGRPRFITVPMIGPVLKRTYNMTDIQIYRLWVLRNQADQAYGRFTQRMIWMKKNVLDQTKKAKKPC